MLQPCVFCLVTHTPINLWCALSMGMPAESPLPERSGGCGLSKCDNGFCACDMRAYDKEFDARVRARIELYNSQLEQRDSLTHRAAAELVDRAVGITLNAIAAVSPSRLMSTITCPRPDALVYHHVSLYQCQPFGYSGTIAYDRYAR